MAEKISRNFRVSEFTCGCGCGYYRACDELVKKLQKLRDKVGLRITVNSGCRCVLHNYSVGGSESSAHLCGKAADISCTDMKLLLCNALKIFSRVGISANYIHVDVDGSKRQDIYWVYVE